MGSGVSQRALEEILSAVVRRWILGYEILGPVTTAVLAVATISVVRMTASVVMRAVIILRMRGPGPWILGVLWDTIFEVALSPMLWAAECGQRGAEAVTHCMAEGAGGAEPSAVEEGSGLLH